MIIHNNVKSYFLNAINELWQITLNNIEDHPEKESQHYFIMSREVSSDAFYHWVFEDCIYIEDYYKLKKEIPNLKIHIGNNKDFKRIFLKYLQVNSEDIVCDLEPINTCYFSDTLHINPSKLFSNVLTEQYIKEKLYNFIKYFEPLKMENIQKTIPILLLPRQKKENYNGNNREYFTDNIEEIILLLDNKNKILNTDIITDLNNQINIIRSAHIIIVTDGSPFIINSIFAYNSHIICIGNDVMENKYTCIDQYSIKHIIDKCLSYNLSIKSFPTTESSPHQININDLMNYIDNI